MSEPISDLAAILEIGPDLTMWDKEDIRIIVKHWPVIRAALERLPQLEAVVEAARRWVEHMDSTVGDVSLALTDATARELEPYWDTKEALAALNPDPQSPERSLRP